MKNSYKADTGRQQALQDKAFFSKLVRREDALRKAVDCRASVASRYAKAWNDIPSLPYAILTCRMSP